MANNLAAFTPVKYALKTIDLLYNETVLGKITNTKYEGTLKESGDRVRVRTSGKITFGDYTKGMTLVPQDIAPTYEDLIIDNAKYFSIIVDDIDKVQNDINALDEYAQNAKRDAAELLDTDVLTYMHKSVNSTNMVGTAYATGTVAIDAAGVVTGTGTTYVAGHVGGIFTATGLTGSFVVTARASNTAITIKNLGGETYTGGVIAAGAAFSIAGAVAIVLTKSNVYEYIVALRTALGKSLAPKDGRWLVVNSQFEGLLLQAPEFIPAVGNAYEDAVKGGMIGRIAGFNVYQSELVDGNNTTGYFFIAGTKEFCSYAVQLDKTAIVPSNTNATMFVDTLKSLLIWGRKVFAGTRAYGAVLRATV